MFSDFFASLREFNFDFSQYSLASFWGFLDRFFSLIGVLASVFSLHHYFLLFLSMPVSFEHISGPPWLVLSECRIIHFWGAIFA